MLQPGQRTSGPGRRHLDSVVPQQVTEVARRPHAEVMVHAPWTIQKHADGQRSLESDGLHEQHLDIGLENSKARLDLSLKRLRIGGDCRVLLSSLHCFSANSAGRCSGHPKEKWAEAHSS